MKEDESKTLVSILDLLGPDVDLEDITFRLSKDNCSCYGDCCCEATLYIETERLETDEEYSNRVQSYLEKQARKNDPERKRKLKEKRQQTLKQKQEEQNKKDLVELERLKKLYEKES